ncbi:hypothetical protein Nmel_013183 [Mimus melanotis]
MPSCSCQARSPRPSQRLLCFRVRNWHCWVRGGSGEKSLKARGSCFGVWLGPGKGRGAARSLVPEEAAVASEGLGLCLLLPPIVLGAAPSPALRGAAIHPPVCTLSSVTSRCRSH